MTEYTKVFYLMTNSSPSATKNCQNVFFNTPIFHEAESFLGEMSRRVGEGLRVTKPGIRLLLKTPFQTNSQLFLKEENQEWGKGFREYMHMGNPIHLPYLSY